MGESLVAQLGVHFGHDGLSCSGFPGLEFEVKSFAPVLLVGRVLSLELLPKFRFSLVAVTGQSVLNFSLSGVAVSVVIVLHSVLKFRFNFGLKAS